MSNKYLHIITIAMAMLLCWNVSSGQRQNEVWHFGLGASLNFSGGQPTALEGSEMLAREGCASISDDDGNLLFYTNGLTVWNSNHEAMPDGEGLQGGRETSSTSQALIAPFPNHPHEYFIFTTDERAGSRGLQYSIVNMTLESGLGNVTLKNQLIYTPTTERMTLAPHTNGVDYWLITHDWGSNAFLTFLIDENGIHPSPVVNAAGAIHAATPITNLNARGCMQINTTANLLAVAIHTDNIVEVFDFNPCTGEVVLLHHISTIIAPYGVAFSPNGAFLYVSNEEGQLFQVDMNTGNGTQVGQTEGKQLGAIQYANDGKLYVAVMSSNHLSVIHAPDSQGVNCGYENEVIDLQNGVSSEGLPQRIPLHTELGMYEKSGFNDVTIQYSSDCEGEYVDFSIQTNEIITDITWQVNDYFPTTSMTYQYTFQDTGWHEVQAILSSACKQDTILDMVYIKHCNPPIFMPNAFTPNFDGHNDLLLPLGNTDWLETYEMSIFSRWGERIFYTKNLTEGWDGTFRGKPAGAGVYVWMIKAKYFGMRATEVWSGDVTLMR